jgi:hypothetical protein
MSGVPAEHVEGYSVSASLNPSTLTADLFASVRLLRMLVGSAFRPRTKLFLPLAAVGLQAVTDRIARPVVRVSPSLPSISASLITVSSSSGVDDLGR